MENTKTTPKDFFLWAGAIVAFYWSVTAFMFLLFDYINFAFPNALAYYPTNTYDSGISAAMASIIVLFPLFVLLKWLIARDAQKDSSRNEIWVRRWALILTLFLAGVVVAGDLIVLLTTFLNGEALTTAFLLKVLVVLLVAAGVFMHFIADLKGYWEKFPAKRNYVRIGVSVLVIATIASGFFIVGTPQQAREARFDAVRVNDLQNLQQEIINYWVAKGALPLAVSEVSEGQVALFDAQTGKPYTYEATGELSYKLCATFVTASQQTVYPNRPEMPISKGVSENWDHGAGKVCFDRAIDPDFYKSVR